ncbi:uncharacterized protein LOC116200184 [Punica granatum]|uniref:Uncharacterized protein LOC116200184 n=2 Tax=Punica granatum TaxID=22663 RepID=A0A6P8CSK8_PUNGR|nr:uncharacterized protein LOC116200184 [Punica granatum]XP_031386796.1 uncharacterized protein LOC116200184 [Punica granatum]
MPAEAASLQVKLSRKLKLQLPSRIPKKLAGGSSGVQSPPRADGVRNGDNHNHERTKRGSKSILMDKKRIFAELPRSPSSSPSRSRSSSKRKQSLLLSSNKLLGEEGSDGPSRSMWVSGGKAGASFQAKVGKTRATSLTLKTEVKDTERWNAGKQKSPAKKHSMDSSGHLVQKQGVRAEVPSSTTARRRQQEKRDAHGDHPEVKDDQPKKRKRVIRLDPHDISNKRLDDGIVVHETIKEKKMESQDSVEISKNAQFRAIQPGPSILSFVEDNLLGRRRTIELRRAGYNTELSAPLDDIPFSMSSERERIEETIFRNKLTFFAAAKVSSSFPPPEVPEIAFAGRSNVGKSSLLNSLTRQWGVARTSDKPGLTQTINFFKLGPKLSLVDLPGYGFAYAKDEVKDAWEELVKEYVSTRIGLKRVCLLIDTKWGMKPRDHELIDLMERSQTKYQIVLTKTDLVFPIDVARRAMQIEENLKASKSIVQPVMMVSSKSGAGIRSLRTVLAKIARIAKV